MVSIFTLALIAAMYFSSEFRSSLALDEDHPTKPIFIEANENDDVLANRFEAKVAPSTSEDINFDPQRREAFNDFGAFAAAEVQLGTDGDDDNDDAAAGNTADRDPDPAAGDDAGKEHAGNHDEGAGNDNAAGNDYTGNNAAGNDPAGNDNTGNDDDDDDEDDDDDGADNDDPAGNDNKGNDNTGNDDGADSDDKGNVPAGNEQVNAEEADPEEAILRKVLNYMGVADELLTPGHKCSWQYVYGCVTAEGKPSRHGFVSSLIAVFVPTDPAIFGLDLTGAALHPDISKLTYLEHIRMELPLSECHPEVFSNLTRLRTLTVKNGGVNCPIFDVHGLPLLRFIDFSENYLQGVIQNELCDLPLLDHLWLHHNKLSGQLPSCLSGHPNLVMLDVSHNGFSGDLNEWLAPMPSLVELRLDYNRFTGSLAPDLQYSPELLHISAPDNSLTGQLPGMIGKLKHLRILDLHSNELAGEIPEALGDAGHLIRINLGDNLFTGSIPASLGNCARLVSLNLAFNHLSGEIPQSLATLPSIQELRLNGNALVAPIPAGLATMPRLNTLDLGHNYALGALPDSFFDAKNGGLSELRIPSSFLSGAIPHGIEKMSKLRVLDLSGNALTDSIPAGLGQLMGLQFLYLGQNRLSGVIPNFSKLTKLLELDLSHNRLVGLIPPELGTLPLLKLSLSHNLLHGKIPKELGGALSQLQVLDMSNNRLKGSIPNSLAFISTLRRLDLSTNAIRGFPAKFIDHASLRQLFFRDNVLVNLGVVAKMSKLAELDISNSPVHGDVSEFSEARSLEKLNISNTFLTWTKTGGFSSAGCLWVASGKVLDLPYLSDFDMSGIPVNSDINKFFRTLAGVPSLRAFAANDCGLLGSVTHRMLQFSGRAVCEMNWHSVSLNMLSHLELRHNHIHGIQPDALSPLASLHTLDLSGNTDLISLSPDVFRRVELIDLRNTGVSFRGPDFLSLFEVSDRQASPKMATASFVCFEPTLHNIGTRILVYAEDFASEELCRCSIGFGGFGTECEPCGPGKYSTKAIADNKESGSCRRCPSGTYNQFARQSSCMQCPQGNQAASTPGASAKRECGCRGGFLEVREAAGGTSCVKCTSSAQPYCLGCMREDTLSEVFVGCTIAESDKLGPLIQTAKTWPGYWQHGNAEPVKCIGLDGPDRSKNGFGHAVLGGYRCEHGHTGFCCSDCLQNFYRRNNDCVQCQEFQLIFFIVASIAVGVVIWFVWSFRNNFLVTLYQRQSIPNELRAVLHLLQPQVSALVKGIQLCAVARVLRGSDSDSQTMQMVWFDLSLVTDVLHLGCIVNDHLSQWLHVLFSPIRPFLTILLILGALRLVPGGTKYGVLVTSYKVSFVVLDLTFIGTMTKLSLTSRCIQIPGTKGGRLAAMTWIICDRPEGQMVWWYIVFFAVSMVVAVVVLRLHSARVYHARCAQLASVSQRAPVRVVVLPSDSPMDTMMLAIELTPSDLEMAREGSALNRKQYRDEHSDDSRGPRGTASEASFASSSSPVVRGPPTTALGRLAARFALRVDADSDLLMQEVVLDGFAAAFYALLVEKLANRGCYQPRRVMHFELEKGATSASRWLVRLDLKSAHLSAASRDNLRRRVVEAKSDRRLAAAPTLQACLLTSAWERRQLHPLLVGTSFWTLMPFGSLTPQTLQLSSAALAAIAATRGSEMAFAGTCACVSLFLTWRPHVLSTTSWGLSISFCVAGLCSLCSGKLQIACVGLLFVAFWLFVAALFFPSWRKMLWPYCLAMAIHEIKWGRVDEDNRARKKLRRATVAYTSKPWLRNVSSVELPKKTVVVPQMLVEGFTLVKVESIGEPKGSSSSSSTNNNSSNNNNNNNNSTSNNNNNNSDSNNDNSSDNAGDNDDEDALHVNELEGQLVWIDTRDLMTCFMALLWRIFTCINTPGAAKRMQMRRRKRRRRRSCWCRLLESFGSGIWYCFTCCGRWSRSRVPTSDGDEPLEFGDGKETELATVASYGESMACTTGSEWSLKSHDRD